MIFLFQRDGWMNTVPCSCLAGGSYWKCYTLRAIRYVQVKIVNFRIY